MECIIRIGFRLIGTFVGKGHGRALDMDNVTKDDGPRDNNGPLAEALLCHIQEYYTKDIRNMSNNKRDNNGTTYKEATSEDDNKS